MYKDIYSKRILEQMEKLKKKDLTMFKSLMNKIEQIIQNPEHSYKELRYHLKGQKRVHIGHFVLIFAISHENKTISFDDFEHHDKVYQ